MSPMKARSARMIVVLAAGTALAIPAGAAAFSNGGGSSDDAAGQATAKDNCHSAYVNQATRGVQSGGGPKSAETGPLNCDHYWQDTGAIGGP
jgi:hypothetical protein